MKYTAEREEKTLKLRVKSTYVYVRTVPVYTLRHSMRLLPG